MLERELQAAIIHLHQAGHGVRKIARALEVSRNTVRRVLRGGGDATSSLRDSSLDEHLSRIRDTHAECDGNLVRVGEELERVGITVGYSTLTAFCRRHDIGVREKKRVGRYHFEPGQEMQHDTSPHRVRVGDRVVRLECASLVLCFSRMVYMQTYPRWSRFECRTFLSEAIQYFGGAAAFCMADNSSVVRAHGTGSDMVPAPAMQALGQRFGFQFIAHAVGDADRSARVERNFHYAENNFYKGRSFDDLSDLNRQFREWCDKVNSRPRKLHGEVKAIPLELFAQERAQLKPLPLHIPEVYDVFERRVDVEGYVNLHKNRYSVPTPLIGRRVEIRETIETVRVFDGRQLVAEHARLQPGAGRRTTLDEHRTPRLPKRPAPPSHEEAVLKAAATELGELVDRLRKKHGGQALRAIRRLHRLYLDYPTAFLVDATRTALDFGVTDIGRLETMTLRRIRSDYFRLPPPTDNDCDNDDGR